MATGENRFALELNEKEVIELLENATPGSTKNLSNILGAFLKCPMVKFFTLDFFRCIT